MVIFDDLALVITLVKQNVATYYMFFKKKSGHKIFPNT